jgi:methionyl-tRNA formyltransferase
MYMNEGLDTGDILLSVPTPIQASESGGELHDRLADLAPDALLEALGQLAEGSAARVSQDSSLATYAPKLGKLDGRLDWLEPAERLARRVRAMTPWPGATARLGGGVLKIHAAEMAEAGGSPGTVLSAGPEGIVVAAGEGSLVLREVQLEGRKRLFSGDFLRGFSLAAGTKFDLSFSGSP